MPQPGGDALAELVALAGRSTTAGARQSCRAQSATRVEGPAHGARDQPRVGGEILVGADVDESRRIGPADQARQSLSGEIVVNDDMVRPR